MEEQKYDLLLDEDILGEENDLTLSEEEGKQIKPIVLDFIKSYAEHSNQPVKTWLIPKMQEELPERTEAEIETMVDDIVKMIEANEEKKVSLQKATEDGRSKESWFASEVKKATSAMTAQEAAKYLTDLDAVLRQANRSLQHTITTKAGVVSQNPRLDGFIAEQYHAQTFNMNAKAKGSSYRAKVLEPNGNGYAKNSVDIVILDGNGKVVKRYQSKYCKNGKATEKAFEHGDYRGQQKLVPEGQQGDISKKSTTVLEAPDGTTSNRLTKERAEQMRDEAQKGQWNDLNWNEYALKDLAMGIGKQVGQAAIFSAAIGSGFYIAQQVWNGEEVELNKVVETAIETGTDAGLKAATTGALKVAVEKEIIKSIPKGTPVGTLTNIVCIAIEDIKVMGKIATGELTIKEGIDKLEQTHVSTAVGLMAMGEGAAIGATAGAVFGPVGAAVGGLLGGVVGYMAGAETGERIAKGRQKIRDKVIEVGKGVITKAKNVVGEVRNFVTAIL